MYEQGKLWLERKPVVRQDKSRVSRSPFDRIRTGASDVGNAALLASKKPWSVIKTDTRTTANSLEENFRNRTTAEADVSQDAAAIIQSVAESFQAVATAQNKTLEALVTKNTVVQKDLVTALSSIGKQTIDPALQLLQMGVYPSVER